LNLTFDVLRAIEDAVEAFARLDAEVAKAAPGLATLLMLRSAEAIVAANDRPIEAAPEGEAGFAALLGWWYAPSAREFIAVDSHRCGVSLALDAAAGMVRGGRAVTAGLLDEAVRAANADLDALPDLLDATLSVAERESWPPMLLAADLSAGACGHVRSVSASLVRVVAPLAGGVVRDAFVVAGAADDAAGALHAMADEARAVRRRVTSYGAQSRAALDRCRDFGRGGPSSAALTALLFARPAITVGEAARALDLSAPTAGAAVERLHGSGLLREITGRGRDRVFVYTPAAALAD